MKKGYFLLRSITSHVGPDDICLMLFSLKGTVYGEGISVARKEELKGYPQLKDTTYDDHNGKGPQKYVGYLKFLPESIRVYCKPITKEFLHAINVDTSGRQWNQIDEKSYFQILKQVVKDGGFRSRLTNFEEERRSYF